jgi:hypothetical protein
MLERDEAEMSNLSAWNDGDDEANVGHNVDDMDLDGLL